MKSNWILQEVADPNADTVYAPVRYNTVLIPRDIGPCGVKWSSQYYARIGSRGPGRLSYWIIGYPARVDQDMV